MEPRSRPLFRLPCTETQTAHRRLLLVICLLMQSLSLPSVTCSLRDVSRPRRPSDSSPLLLREELYHTNSATETTLSDGRLLGGRSELAAPRRSARTADLLCCSFPDPRPLLRSDHLHRSAQLVPPAPRMACSPSPDIRQSAGRRFKEFIAARLGSTRKISRTGVLAHIEYSFPDLKWPTDALQTARRTISIRCARWQRREIKPVLLEKEHLKKCSFCNYFGEFEGWSEGSKEWDAV